MPTTLVTRDLQEIAESLGDYAHHFSASNVLISGGHGFLGRYFIELMEHLNSKVLDQPCALIVLDNQITSGMTHSPVDDLPNVTFIKHDVVLEFSYDKANRLHYPYSGYRESLLLCKI